MKMNLKEITYKNLIALMLNKSWSPSYLLPPKFLYPRTKGVITEYIARAMLLLRYDQ